MKRNLISLAGFCFIAIAVISGCTKTTEVTTIGPVSTGQIVGSVQLEEMDCTASASSAGVNVQILGTTINAFSDSAGNFVMDSVPAGYYSIQYSKPGFAEYIWPLTPFVGGGVLRLSSLGYSVTLGRIPNWKTTISTPIVSVNYSAPDTSYDLQYPSDSPTVLDSSGNSVGVSRLLYFMGKKPNVNYLDTTTYIFFSSYPFLSSSSVHAGDTIYAVAYPFPCGTDELKYNYFVGDSSEASIPAAYGPPSNTVKFILP